MSEPIWDPDDTDGPSRKLLDRIGDRWTVLVVGTLESGPKRFSELHHGIDGISQKMLTQTLRGLERDGLAKRTVYAEVPPRVVYELSPTGRSLIEPLTALTAWATTHMTDVKTAQSAYDKVNVTSV